MFGGRYCREGWGRTWVGAVFFEGCAVLYGGGFNGGGAFGGGGGEEKGPIDRTVDRLL